jgi:hypothetical protein
MINHEYGQAEREKFEALLPASKGDIRDLFYYLDTDRKCTNTFVETLEFLEMRRLPREPFLTWLHAHGACCDCEVIFNVEDTWNQMVDEEWQRPASAEELSI